MRQICRLLGPIGAVVAKRKPPQPMTGRALIYGIIDRNADRTWTFVLANANQWGCGVGGLLLCALVPELAAEFAQFRGR